MSETVFTLLKQSKMQMRMLEDELVTIERHQSIERIGKVIQSLEALRYAIFQQRPSGTP